MRGSGSLMAADYGSDGAVPVATPELEQVIARVQMATNQIADIARSASRTVDRLFGAAPEPAMNSGGPQTAGTLSLLHAALDGLEEHVRMADGYVQRLEGL